MWGRLFYRGECCSASPERAGRGRIGQGRAGGAGQGKIHYMDRWRAKSDRVAVGRGGQEWEHRSTSELWSHALACEE